jgi:hypothetical protein
MFILDTRVTKLVTAVSAWETVDLSAVIPAGANGAIVEVWNSTATVHSAMVRKPGMDLSFVTHAEITSDTRVIYTVATDASRRIDCWQSDSSMRFDIIGWTTTCTFGTSGQLVSGSTYQAWYDIDVTPHVSSDAVGALLLVNSADNNPRNAAFRKKGSTDDFHLDMDQPRASVYYQIVGLDESKKFQAWIEMANVTVYLMGHFRAVDSWSPFQTNLVDKTPASGAWHDINLSAEAAGADCVIMLGMNTDPAVQQQVALRKNGSSDDRLSEQYVHVDFGMSMPGQVDGSAVLEGYAGGAPARLYFMAKRGAVVIPMTAAQGGYAVGMPVLQASDSRQGFSQGWSSTPLTASRGAHTVATIPAAPGGWLDYYGNHVPAGSAPDIGIHEFQPEGETNYLASSRGGHSYGKQAQTAARSGYANGQTPAPVQSLAVSADGFVAGSQQFVSSLQGLSIGTEETPPPPPAPTGHWWSLAETKARTRAGDRYAYPRDPAAPLPIVYGNMAENAIYGAWEAPCIDTNSHTYMIGDHAVLSVERGNSFKFFDKDNLEVETGNYSVHPSYMDELGNTISYAAFGADMESREPLTVRCKGKVNSGGTLIENPIEIAEDMLVSYCAAQAADFNATTVARARQYAAGQNYRAAGVIKEDAAPGAILSQLLSCFMASWWKDNGGQLTFRFLHGSASVTEIEVCAFVGEAHLSGLEVEARLDNLANTIETRFAWNCSAGKFEKTDAGASSADALSVSYYGTRSKMMEMPWIRNDAVARQIQTVAVDWYSRPRQIITARNDSYNLVHLERGDVVAVTHSSLKDADGNGLVNQMARVMEINLVFGQGELEIKLLDLGMFLTSGRALHFSGGSDRLEIPPLAF